jgi:hypothetical protein
LKVVYTISPVLRATQSLSDSAVRPHFPHCGLFSWLLQIDGDSRQALDSNWLLHLETLLRLTRDRWFAIGDWWFRDVILSLPSFNARNGSLRNEFLVNDLIISPTHTH